MKLLFATPCAFSSDAFVASFGFTGVPAPTDSAVRAANLELNGVLLTGTYEEILSSVDDIPNQAAVVALGNAGREDDFIRALQDRAKCQLTGGAAAIDPVTGKAGLIAGGGQAAVFLIRDDRYDVQVVSENIHDVILGECKIEMDGKRTFKTINGEDALTWYNAQRAKYGIGENDFEHLTFSDMLGINAHTSVRNGRLVSGRDLEETMLLRMVRADQVFPRMDAFYAHENAVVFGCAGLKGILPQPIMGEGAGLFMFGEVCTVDGISKFGNLMLSKLCICPKK